MFFVFCGRYKENPDKRQVIVPYMGTDRETVVKPEQVHRFGKRKGVRRIDSLHGNGKRQFYIPLFFEEVGKRYVSIKHRLSKSEPS